MRSFIHSKKIAGVLLTLGITTAAFAQPLNGTYTVGGVSPNYATLSAAAADLNTKGVSGPVTFNIRDSVYKALAWRAEIKTIAGASATNRITIKPESNNPAGVTIHVDGSASTTNYVLKLNGASFITIKDITFRNEGGTYGRSMDISSTSGNDSIINCRFESIVRTSGNTNTALLYASGVTGANNVILGNNFLNGSYSLYYAGGSATNLAQGVLIANNTFKNSYQYYINVDNTNNAKVISNLITTYNSASTTSYGIRMDNCHGALEVRNNRLDSLRAGYGIYISESHASASNKADIANNIILFGVSSSLVRALYSTGTSNHRIYNNTVSVRSTSATTGYAAYFLYDAAAETGNEVYNNVFANVGGGFAMFVEDPTLANVFDYNNLYATGAKLTSQGITTPATDYANLTAWRAAFGLDMNSISYDPGFISTKNVQPNVANAASWSLNGRGIHIPGNNKDINGNTRAVDPATGVPDIGAFEFTPTVAPPNAIAVPAAPVAGGTQVFTFGLDTVASIAWAPSSPVPSSITVKQYSGVSPAGIGGVSSTSMFFYTDIAGTAGGYNYTSNIYYKEPWLGTIAAESGLRLVKKDGSNPWQPFSPAVSSADWNRNFITTPNLATFGWNTGIDVANNASVREITDPVPGTYCSGVTVPVKVKIGNTGSNVINSVQVNWSIDGVLQTPVSYTNTLPVSAEATVSLGSMSFSNGYKTVKVWTSLPNNGVDPSSNDDTLTFAFRDGLSGIFTVGGASPDYPTISSAINALNTFGICGPVTLNIRNGIYNEQAQLNALPGSSAVNRITIKSESGNAANVTMGFDATGTTDNYVLKINASYVTVKNMTIAPKDSTYMRGIELAGTVTTDSILNCQIVGIGTTKSSDNAALLFADNITGRGNVIKDNTFGWGSYGLFYSGTGTTNLADSATIVGNTFTNQYTYGTYLYYTNNLKYNNNTISTNSANTTFYGIYSYYGDGAIQIMNNKVSGALGGYGINQYYSDASATLKGIVANNVISIGSGTNTTYGLRNQYCSNQRIYNNSVNVAGTSATLCIAGYFYYSSTSYEGNEINNNVFSNTGGGYAIYVYNPTYSNTFDYNNLYTKGAKLVDRGTPATDYANLTAWRAATGHDRNSVSFNPGFTSITNLKPNAANDSSWSLNGRGIHIAGNDKDVDGNNRAVLTSTGVPDIGAYEFTPTVVPPVAVATPASPAAGTTQVFTFGEDTVATINWDAAAAVPATIQVRQYTGTLPVNISAVSSRSMYFYTDIAAPNGTYAYNSSIYYKEPWMGTITGSEVALRLAKKEGTNQWALSSPANSTANVARNFIYTTGLTDFGHNTGLDINNNAGLAAMTSPSSRPCPGTYPVKVIVKNNGGNVLNSVKVNWTINGVAQTTLNYSTAIPTKGEAEVTLGTVVFANSNYTIKVWTSEPNGAADSVSADDTLTVSLRDGMDGVYTVGGTTPDYTTINAAINDLVKYGMCGPVTISIRNGNYNEQVQVGAITGLSAANRLTFKSEANNAFAVNVNFAATAAANNYVFRFSDASYISLKDLTFTAGGTTQARAVQFVGTSSFDSVLNCRLVGPVVTTLNTATSTLFGDDLTGQSIVFKGNSFQNGSYGAYFRGTSTSSLVENIVFDGNTFDNQYTYAAFPYYVKDLKFNNNVVTTTSTDNTFYGIYTGYCDGALEVTRNKVTNAQGGYGIYIYYCDATSATRGIVSNNTVSMGAGTNTSYGLRVSYSSYQNVYNNSVNILSGSATSYAGYIYSNSSTTTNNDIKNNVFAHQGIGYALYVYDPQYNSSDYNNLYTTGQNLVDLGTPATDFQTLQQWRSASGQEMNSIVYDPGFISNVDLRPDPAKPASWSLNGRGVQIASNNLDMDKNPRITNVADGAPDLGAYEFTPTSTPPAAVATPATPAAGTTQVYTFGQDTVAVITWKPNSVMPNFIEIRQYSGDKAPQFTQPGFMYFHTDVNTQTVTHNFDAAIYYKDIWKGTISTEANLRMMKKLGTNPWTAFNGTESSVNTSRNILNASLLSSFGVFTGGNDGDIFSANIKPATTTVFCPGSSTILNATTGANYSYQWAFNGTPIPGATSSSLVASQAGDYTVTVTDNAKAQTVTSEKVAITQIAAPSPTVAASGALTYCPGSSLMLSTSVVPGLTYQWQLNGTAIAGATSPTHQVTSAGQYTVMANNVACGAVSPVVSVAAGPLALSIGNDTAFCESPTASLVLDAGHAGATYTWNTGATTQQIAALTSGKYWVEVDAGPGCVATDTIQVTVNPLPTISGISYNRSGNTFQFSANGVMNANSYFWIFSDGVTSSALTPSHTFTIEPVDVTLIVTNNCGSDTLKLKFNTTGVNEVNKDELFLNLYPNPASDKITLQVEGAFELENIAIVNQLGQVIMKEEFNGGVTTKTIDVSNLPVGYYILRAGTSDGMIAKPFNITR